MEAATELRISRLGDVLICAAQNMGGGRGRREAVTETHQTDVASTDSERGNEDISPRHILLQPSGFSAYLEETGNFVDQNNLSPASFVKKVTLR
jgi:hypothetical protein